MPGKNCSEYNKYRLSPCEKEILELLAHGLSRDEISEQLFKSRRTIDFHVKKMRDKSGVHGTTVSAENSTIKLLAFYGEYTLKPQFSNTVDGRGKYKRGE